jgi:hypothetical protein
MVTLNNKSCYILHHFFILNKFILFLIKTFIQSDIRHSYIHLYSVHSLVSSLLLPLIIVGSLITVRALSITNIMAIFKTKTTYHFEEICR